MKGEKKKSCILCAPKEHMLHRRFNEIVQLHWELVKTEDRLETYIRPTKKESVLEEGKGK